MDYLCFVVAGIFGYASGCAGHPAGAACERYIRAFQRPGVAQNLESWYRRLPKEFDRSKLTDPKSLGFNYRPYVLELDFDPKEIGLGSKAHAEIRLTSANELEEVLITDERRVMYLFRVNEAPDEFRKDTVPEATNDTVGVSCWKGD